jgi:hypothetical protein
MAAEMENMFQMLQNVNKSMEVRDLEIKEFEAQVKAYSAEIQRISAVQAGMSPEQIQDIVMGTIAAAMDTGDLVGGMPQMPEQQMLEMQQPQMAPEQGQMPPEGMM